MQLLKVLLGSFIIFNQKQTEMITQKYMKEIDGLAVGLTRPPLFMGINIRVFFANVMLCAVICIDAHTFWGIPLFLVLHLLMLRLSVKESNFFYISMKALIKTPPVLNSLFWGKTNSYEAW